MLVVRAISTETGAPLFTIREQATGKGEVSAALDRLSRATRLALRERDADVRGSDIRLADAVTSSLLAYQHYAASQQCMYRTSFGQDCAEHLEKALAADPTFALAHYQLAVWRAHHGGSREEQRTATEAASRHIARVPPKERSLIRAWVAHFDGRDDEALEHLARLVEQNPSDEEGIYEAGDLLYHRSEFDRAVPWFERQLHLDPQLAHGWGLEHLAHSLGALGRTDELRKLADGWSAAPANAVNLHALVTALAWLGDLPGAEAAARREEAAGGGLSALEDRAYVAIMAGQYDDVRAALSPLAAPGSPAPAFGYLALAALDAYQGRRAAGRARLDAMARDLGPAGQDALVRGMRIQYLAGDADPTKLLAEVEGLRALDPEAAAVHAPMLAWLGHVPEAGRLAPHLRKGSPGSGRSRRCCSGSAASGRRGCAGSARSRGPPRTTSTSVSHRPSSSPTCRRDRGPMPRRWRGSASSARSSSPPRCGGAGRSPARSSWRPNRSSAWVGWRRRRTSCAGSTRSGKAPTPTSRCWRGPTRSRTGSRAWQPEGGEVGIDLRVRGLLDGGDLDLAATAALEDLGPAILGWLRALHGADDGDEVFAEFAERLWKGLPAFRGESPLRAWAYRIAWNASHSFRDDAWRRRRQRLATSAASNLAARLSRSADPARDEARLARLQSLLPPEDHALLVLRLDREMSWEEIADVLSASGPAVSAAALRKRYERVKERLARRARDEGLLE